MLISRLLSIRPLSITSYSVIFILVGLLFFSGFSWVALQDLSRLNQQAKQKNLSLAKEELHFTVNELLSEVDKLALLFARWEETTQQLTNPTYYSYWREHRVPNASFIPAYFVGVELYDVNGEVLSTSYDRDMPGKIILPLSDLQIIKRNNTNYIVFLKPIIEDKIKNHVIGYVGIKISVIKAVMAIQRFRYIDLPSLELDVEQGRTVAKENLVNYFRSNVKPNLEFSQLQVLLFETLLQFGTTGVGLALLFWCLLVILFGIPLRQLSQQIDALRAGKQSMIQKVNNIKLPVAEFEKVRMSLNDYQVQLDHRDAALRENETRMRAVLENVVDGIITIDQEGVIESYNPATHRIFGFGEQNMLGVNLSALIAESSLHTYYGYYNHCVKSIIELNQMLEACELVGKRNDKTEFPIEVVISTMEVNATQFFIMVVRDISERKRAEQRLISLANYDELTGLPNRTLFLDRLAQAVARAHRNELLAAMIFIDLDRFKRINDTMGHHIGDELLMSAAKRLNHSVREIDTVGRFGGDEFVVILENINHIDEISSIVSKMLESLDKPFMLEEQEVFIAASAGITVFPFDDTDIDNLVRNADTAMFRAKQQGGSNFQFFTADMNRQEVERLNFENALRHALDRNEFELFYQPRIDIASGKINAMEALLRWHHPELGMVSPVKFIPILEDTGWIVEVGEWVLKTACKQTEIWNRVMGWDLCVSVNLSMRQFQNSELVESFNSIIVSTGLQHSCLELEITEGVLVENYETAITTLNAFHDLGIKISIDDFGTAYSSLSYLKRFPIDTLKIDRSFVRDISLDPDDAALTTAIVALARSLHLSVTAEGVETEDQLEFLKNLHCDEAQGFYFSKPLPVKEFELLFSQQNENIVNY